MALTVGSGPFGREAAGRFNFDYDAPAHILYLEPSPRRLRLLVGGEVLADSVDAKLLHETGLLPVYYLPVDDVRMELLRATDHTTHCPFKGDAAYFDIDVHGDRRSNAVWTYPEPAEGAPDLTGLVAFYFDAVDEWFEEAERIGVHPRDPYHRVDVIPSDRQVTVRIGDVVVAESRHPTVLFETGLPPRYYLPGEDVRRELLEPSDTVTSCPYKGTTNRYWSIRTDDGVVEDAIWVYEDPTPEARGVEGLLAFYDEKVGLEVNTDRWDSPTG